jgi:hypothetical protein
VRFLEGESAGESWSARHRRFENPGVATQAAGTGLPRIPRLGKGINSDRYDRPEANPSRSRAGWTLDRAPTFPPGPGDGAAGAEVLGYMAGEDPSPFPDSAPAPSPLVQFAGHGSGGSSPAAG